MTKQPESTGGMFGGIMNLMGASRRGMPIEVEERASSTEQDREVLEQLGLIEGGRAPFSSSVTERAALGIAAVWAAVRYISDSIAVAPTFVSERVSDTETIRVHDHPVAEFLRSPCSEFPEYTCTQTLLASANMHGDGVALIEWTPNRVPISLRVMDARHFNVRHLDNQALFKKNLVYEFPTHGGFGHRFLSSDVIHIRSMCTPGQLKGISPIRNAARTLAIATEAERYSGHLYAGGGKPAGVVQVPQAMNDVPYKRFKESLMRVMDRQRTDPGSMAMEPLILEDGAVFNPWAMSAEDASLMSTRAFQVEEVARIYRVPPHKIGSLTKSSFNNIEQQNIDAVTDSLLPWVTQLEQEYTRKLIHPKERDRFSVRFDLKAIIRGDFKSRTEGYKNLAAIGVMTADEMRRLEDLNPLADGMGERPRVTVNTMPSPTKEQADQHVEKLISDPKPPKSEPGAPGEDGGDGDKNPAGVV